MSNNGDNKKHADFEQLINEHPTFDTEWIELMLHDEPDAYGFDECSTPETQKYVNDVLQKAILKSKSSSLAPRSRRSRYIRGIALAACTILGIFFFITFTEPGRALSRFIINLVNGDLHIQVIEIPEGSYPGNTDFDSESFSSLSEAAEFLDYPLICINHNDIDIESVNIKNVGFGVEIISTYRDSDGNTVILTMLVTIEWQDASSVLKNLQNKNYIEHTLSNDEIMYCFSNELNESIGLAIWDNIYLHISSDSIKWDSLVNYVDKLSTE